MEVKKHQKNELFEVKRLFKGREEQTKLFFDNYTKMANEIPGGTPEVKVLNYYGIEGIGKTALIDELENKKGKNGKQNIKCVKCDLNDACDDVYALKTLRDLLYIKYKIRFPNFDTAVETYSKKVGNIIELEEDETRELTRNLVSDVAEVAGEMPQIGSITKSIYNIVARAVSLNNAIKEINECRKYRDLSIKELYKKLPLAFSIDLTNYMQKQKSLLVIFIDSYDHPLNEAIESNFANSEHWIRGEGGIVKSIPNVMWVIAGRAKLDWDKYDSDWSGALIQNVLKKLNMEDSIEFLNDAGITDKKLCEQIFEFTQGTPGYLSVCVDYYNSLKEADKKTLTIDDFGTSKVELVKNIAKHMDNTTRDIVSMLSVLGKWNDDLAFAAGKKGSLDFNADIYEMIKEYSFIRQLEDDSYIIDKTVCNVFVNECNEQIKNAAALAGIDYYKAKIEKDNLKTWSIEYAECIKEMMKYGLLLDETEFNGCFDNTLKDGIYEVISSGKYRQINSVFTEYIEKAKTCDNVIFKAFIDKFYACVLIRETNYTAAYEVASRSHVLFKKINGDDDLDTISAEEVVALSLDNLGRFEESLKLRKHILDARVSSLGEEHTDTIDAYNNYADSLYYLDKIYEEYITRKKIYDLKVKTLGENDIETVMALSNLFMTSISAVINKKEYEEARKVLLLTSKEQTPSSNYDELPSEIEDTEKVYETGKLFLELSKQYYGEEHHNTITALSTLSIICRWLKKYDEEKEWCEKRLELSKKVYGENHPITAYSLARLADSYYFLENYEKYMELYNKVYDIRKNVYGDDHPYIASTLISLSTGEYKLGSFEKSYDYAKRAYEMFVKHLGEEHSLTIGSINNLSASSYELGNGEAVKWSKMVYDLKIKASKNQFGDQE